MPGMIDMKLPKKTKEEMDPKCMPSVDNQEQWPYGLRLNFEKEQVDKMPSLKSLNVGEKVLIQAEASVTQISISERQSGKEEHNVSIQVEKISVEPLIKKKLEEMSPSEYRKARTAGE